MKMGPYTRIFGVGPGGALISLLLLVAALAVEHGTGLPPILDKGLAIRVAGTVLVVMGLVLHGWTMYALRHWWQEGKLCTAGPFRFVRHPMYAAWISIISPGVALILNSWTVLGILPLVHLIWHHLVASEEGLMNDEFGDEYRRYAARTGRFAPRIGFFGRN